MTRVHQRGSVTIAGYIVVGIILAIVVIGGVYFAKHQLAANFSDQKRGEGTVLTFDGDQNTSVDTTKDQDQGAAGEPTDKDGADQTTSNENNNDQSTMNDDATANSGSGDTNTSEAPRTGNSESYALPATGAGDGFAQAGALTALTTAGAIYLRSRRS